VDGINQQTISQQSINQRSSGCENKDATTTDEESVAAKAETTPPPPPNLDHSSNYERTLDADIGDSQAQVVQQSNGYPTNQTLNTKTAEDTEVTLSAIGSSSRNESSASAFEGSTPIGIRSDPVRIETSTRGNTVRPEAPERTVEDASPEPPSKRLKITVPEPAVDAISDFFGSKTQQQQQQQQMPQHQKQHQQLQMQHQQQEQQQKPQHQKQQQHQQLQMQQQQQHQQLHMQQQLHQQLQMQQQQQQQHQHLQMQQQQQQLSHLSVSRKRGRCRPKSKMVKEADLNNAADSEYNPLVIEASPSRNRFMNHHRGRKFFGHHFSLKLWTNFHQIKKTVTILFY
jgi:hypothetical protein